MPRRGSSSWPKKGRELLRTVYRVPAEKIEVIPHGIPDFAFVEPDQAKARFGFSGKPVILTFGLLSPNKGIEVMIDAMPSILKSRPDAVYVVLGATHPNLVRDQGEAYRESLVARVRELGVEDHVVFLDQFVDQATLLDFISMCDVYVTPYLNEAQMTSGTLAYSFGLGKAVVSTPYWHARELLADGRGILVPFGDAAAIGSEIAELLTDDARRQAMRERAYASSRSMTWERNAERYLAAFESGRRAHRLKVISRTEPKRAFARQPRCAGDAARPFSVDVRRYRPLPACGPFGARPSPWLLRRRQCAGAAVGLRAQQPRRAAPAGSIDSPLGRLRPACVESRHEAVSQLHELRSELARRQRLGGQSRPDALGLGRVRAQRRQPIAPALGRLAVRRSTASGGGFRSPRAWAFTLLGLDAYCAAVARNSYAGTLRHLLADRLMSMSAGGRRRRTGCGSRMGLPTTMRVCPRP